MSREIEDHNDETYREMIRSLQRLYSERVANGKAGAIGVRVSFRRGKLGEIHEINETVKSIRGAVQE